jgi:hypothetical protein
MSASDRKRKYADLVVRCEHQRQAISELAKEIFFLNQTIDELTALTTWISTKDSLPKSYEHDDGIRSDVHHVMDKFRCHWLAHFDPFEDFWVSSPSGTILPADIVLYYAPLLPAPQ